MVLEKTIESPLDCKEIQPVHPKGDQSWVFFGRNDVEEAKLRRGMSLSQKKLLLNCTEVLRIVKKHNIRSESRMISPDSLFCKCLALKCP